MSNLDQGFFSREIEKLNETFKYANYTGRRSQLIYMAVKTLTPKEFAHIVDEAIGNFKSAPTVKDFQDLSRKYVKEAIKVPCSDCNGEGLLSRYEKRTGLNFAFKCSCTNGSRYKNHQSFAHIDKSLFTTMAPGKIDPTGKTDCYVETKKFLKEFAEKEKNNDMSGMDFINYITEKFKGV